MELFRYKFESCQEGIYVKISLDKDTEWGGFGAYRGIYSGIWCCGYCLTVEWNTQD